MRSGHSGSESGDTYSVKVDLLEMRRPNNVPVASKA